LKKRNTVVLCKPQKAGAPEATGFLGSGPCRYAGHYTRMNAADNPQHDESAFLFNEFALAIDKALVYRYAHGIKKERGRSL